MTDWLALLLNQTKQEVKLRSSGCIQLNSEMLWSPVTKDYQCLRVSDHKTWWRHRWPSCLCHPQCYPLDKKKSEICILNHYYTSQKCELSPTMQMLSFKTCHHIHINVTLWHVHETTIAVKKQLVLHIQSVCSLSCSACKAHVLYHVICGLYGSTIFFHIIIS